MRFFFVFTLKILICSLPWLASASSPYAGYVANVKAEKSQRFYEIYLLAPQKESGPSLRELIFTPLSKEFKDKYRERFGDNDTASINYRSAAWGGTTDNPKSVLEENAKRRSFAEYVTKRLTEYHVDNYMKTQPQMRPVMEVKEKIQNVKVEVTKEVRLNIQYNFAGNTADVILDNPYCDSKLSLEMDPRAFGPTNPNEVRVWLGRNLNSSWRLNSNLAATDGIAYADLTRRFAKYHIGTMLGLSSYFHEKGASPRETRYLIGFSHSY